MPEHFAAGLDHPSAGQRHCFDTPSGAVASLEHEHVGPLPGEISRRGKTAQPGAEHGDIDQLPNTSLIGHA
jgi:hypothetical protein